MPIENNMGPGGVDAAYGKRTTLPTRSYDTTKRYGDTFREDGDGPVNSIVKEAESGFVGIGTDSPVGTLNLSGTSADPAELIFTRSDGAVGSKNWYQRVEGNHRFALGRANDSGTVSNEYVTVATDGKVGIGVVSPNRALTIGDSGVIGINNTGNTVQSTIQMAAGGLEVYTPGAQSIVLGTNSSERLRIDSAGNVGVGMVPGQKLDVSGGARANWFGMNVAATPSGLGTGIAAPVSDTLGFYTNTTERVRIDSSGRVGVNVTPSSWGSSFKSLEVGATGNGIGCNVSGANTFLTNNLYSDGTNWRYNRSNASTLYEQSLGWHSWHVVGSGTADTVAYPTAAMVLNNTGNLGVGTASPSASYRIHAQSTGVNQVASQGTTDAAFINNVNGTQALYMHSTASMSEINELRAVPLNIVVNGATRATFDANGNLLRGTTTNPFGGDQAGYVNSNGTQTATWGVSATYGGSFIGSYSNHSFGILTNNTTRLTISAAGDILSTGGGLGYGTGSGGTVTQATSKSTAVTLNKPSGKITMNNAALAAGATVQFQLINSLITADDLLVVNRTGSGTNLAYQIWTEATAAGSAYINVKNVSAGSLSEAIVINFAIIKGATS